MQIKSTMRYHPTTVRIVIIKKKTKPTTTRETSLVVQWLGIHAFNAGDAGSIPGQRTKFPCTAQPKNK